MKNIIDQLPIWQTALIIAFVIVFAYQLIYWLRQGTIAKFRNKYRVAQNEPLPEVSVIIIVNENLYYVKEFLPLLLEQDHPRYEVVVVNDCGGNYVDDELALLAKTYPHLKYTTLKKDEKFNHSRKIPLVIGMKAATYENVVMANCDALPTNRKWLSYMCRGFSGGADLVIGYTGLELKRGIANKIMRASRLAMSIRYLKASTKGKPYRGIYNNIGYTKKTFFESKGYTNLSTTIGEDDLYIQKLAKQHCRTSTIINPMATLRQVGLGGLKWWWNEQRYHTYAYRYYPRKIKLKTATELFTRTVLNTIGAILIVLSIKELIAIPYLWAGAAALIAIRKIMTMITIRKIAKRLGEPRIVIPYMVYDFIEPLTQTLLAISRRINPSPRIWVQNSK